MKQMVFFLAVLFACTAASASEHAELFEGMTVIEHVRGPVFEDHTGSSISADSLERFKESLVRIGMQHRYELDTQLIIISDANYTKWKKILSIDSVVVDRSDALNIAISLDRASVPLGISLLQGCADPRRIVILPLVSDEINPDLSKRFGFRKGFEKDKTFEVYLVKAPWATVAALAALENKAVCLWQEINQMEHRINSQMRRLKRKIRFLICELNRPPEPSLEWSVGVRGVLVDDYHNTGLMSSLRYKGFLVSVHGGETLWRDEHDWAGNEYMTRFYGWGIETGYRIIPWLWLNAGAEQIERVHEDKFLEKIWLYAIGASARLTPGDMAVTLSASVYACNEKIADREFDSDAGLRFSVGIEHIVMKGGEER